MLSGNDIQSFVEGCHPSNSQGIPTKKNNENTVDSDHYFYLPITVPT